MALRNSIPRTVRIALTGALLIGQPIWAATIVVDGGCTLVDAITSANTDTASGGCTAGAGADRIRLTADITLTAVDNGDNGLPEIASMVTIVGDGHTLARDGAAPDFRLLSNTASGSLRIEDLTLIGGNLGYPDDGGAVFNSGELTLVDSFVLENHAGDAGGGIANKSDGQTTLVNTTVSRNSSSGNGGGIYSDFDSPVTIVDSTISANATTSFGDGGGIFSYSGVAISNSTISGNTTSFRGGGVGTLYAYYWLSGNSMVDTEVSFNYASSSGGGIYSGVGSSEVMVNVTVSGNESGFRGGGIYNASYGPASLNNVTISGNTAPSGGGIYEQGGGFILTDSVVANSSGDNCFGAIADGGGNFADDVSCRGASRITGLDPALADNGGPTRTHALLAGSSAIDAGGDCGLPADQRGFGRDPACDSGAYEHDGAPLVGGSVGGLSSPSLRCSNLTSGETIQVSGFDSWDCRKSGLAIASGDEVRQQVRGRLVEPAFLGAVEGIVGGRVKCRNQTTGDEIRFPLGGHTSWNCSDRGLPVSRNDRVTWTVAGTAD